jgi:hypothetical protein
MMEFSGIFGMSPLIMPDSFGRTITAVIKKLIPIITTRAIRNLSIIL